MAIQNWRCNDSVWIAFGTSPLVMTEAVNTYGGWYYFPGLAASAQPQKVQAWRDATPARLAALECCANRQFVG